VLDTNACLSPDALHLAGLKRFDAIDHNVVVAAVVAGRLPPAGTVHASIHRQEPQQLRHEHADRHSFPLSWCRANLCEFASTFHANEGVGAPEANRAGKRGTQIAKLVRCLPSHARGSIVRCSDQDHVAFGS